MQNAFIWVAIGGVILLAMLGGVIPNPLDPNKAQQGPPGPGAQGQNAIPHGGVNTAMPPYGPGGTPNGTLQTIQGGIVVANNALGFFQNLSEYFGSNADSEYPVAQSNTASVPIVSDYNSGPTNFLPVDTAIA